MVLTSSYGQCCKEMIGFIRAEQRCAHHDWDPMQRFKRSHDRICTFNVSVVRINGNTMRVGAPTESPYDVLFRSTNLVFTSSYGQCWKVMVEFIRVELRCTHHDWDPLQRFRLSHDRICELNVSILCILCTGVIMFH